MAEARIAALGLVEKEVQNIMKNEDLTKTLIAMLDTLEVKECDAKMGNLLFKTATKVADAEARVKVGQYIVKKGIASQPQCDAAIKFVNAAKGHVDPAALEAAAGVGVTVTREQVKGEVAKAVEGKKEQLLKERYQFNTGRFLGDALRIPALKWASPEDVKAEITEQIEALLGPKTAADAPQAKAAPKPAAKAAPAEKEEQVGFCDLRPGEATVPIGTGSPEERLKLIDEALADPGEGPLLSLKAVGEKAKAGFKFEELGDVVVRGWVHQYRKQGTKIGFVVLRDGTGGKLMQCVIRGQAPDLVRESSIALRGTLKAEEKAAEGECQLPVEMQVSAWALIGSSHTDIENVINHTSDVDVRLNQRHIHLRWNGPAALQRVRTCCTRAFREHFWSVDCNETQPSTLVQTQCEGGSTLFDFDYYGEKSYLTQSSQLYLETAIPFMGDCFCMLPSYRAEKSKTKRHLSEFMHIEAEYPFIRFEQLLGRIEGMVIDVTRRLMKLCGDEIRLLNPGPAADWKGEGDGWKECYVPKPGFRRLAHSDAIKFCREKNIYKDEATKEHFGDEDDIPDAPERAMVAALDCGPIFMMNFPATIKSFYMKRCDDEAERHLTESVDLLMPGVGEIVGGSMRIHNFKELMEGYEREELAPDPYYWFTDQRRYGSTPHGGFGLGLERFLLWLCNGKHCEHVRDTCLYPRFMGRCTP